MPYIGQEKEENINADIFKIPAGLLQKLEVVIQHSIKHFLMQVDVCSMTEFIMQNFPSGLFKLN